VEVCTDENGEGNFIGILSELLKFEAGWLHLFEYTWRVDVSEGSEWRE
jgi:hypothetical protein